MTAPPREPDAWMYTKEGQEPCFNGHGRRFETYGKEWTEVPLYAAPAPSAAAAQPAERFQFGDEVKLPPALDPLPAESPAPAATDDLVTPILKAHNVYLDRVWQMGRAGVRWPGGQKTIETRSADEAGAAFMQVLRATVERQAREIADYKQKWIECAAERTALSAQLADGYHAAGLSHHVGILVNRAERAEAERDALRECVRELVACADESDSLAAERLYGKPHTPEYKTRELDHRQRSIEAWKAARAKVRT